MRDKFIPTNNDLSYYPLLWKGIDIIRHSMKQIVELGMGHGSTPLLHDFVTQDTYLGLFSYETNPEWLSKFFPLSCTRHLMTLIDPKGWHTLSGLHPSPGLLFVDHAPGERRKEDIDIFKDRASILVVHDTEPAADAGYQMRQHFSKFKFCVEVKTNGAWATALSNFINLLPWVGEKFGDYEISAYQR